MPATFEADSRFLPTSEIDAALATVARQQAGALIVNADPLFSSRQDQVVALAARYRIPTSYFNRDFTAAGGLMTNVDDRAESLRQAYIYVGRILKGRSRSLCRSFSRPSSIS